MQIATTTTFRLSSLFGLLIIFVSSTSCGQEISVGDGEKWFSQNKEALLSLNHRILEQPSIRRVEPNHDLNFVPKYEEFSRDTEEAYKDIQRAASQLNIKNIAIARVEASPKGKLIGIRYILKSYGILVSGGGFLSIQYSPDEYFARYLYEPENTVSSLGIEGWYVVVYRDSS